MLRGRVFFRRRLHRQPHATLVVCLDHLDAHDLAFLQIVGDLIDPLLGDLRDVQQAVLARNQLHDRAEIEQAQHRAFVDLADLDFGRDVLDPLARHIACIGVHRRDRDAAIILDVDRRAGFLGQRANHRAALPDHVADLFGIDLERHHPRRVLRDLGPRVRQRFLHELQDMQPPFARLRQRDRHDFLRDALDLDVHLERRDTAVGARNLEVHVAQVILVAEDVGQHGEAVAFLDQAHRDAGNVRLRRHAGVHQREARAADRRHRRAAVRLGDLRHDTHRIREFLAGGQDREQRALGEPAVADLAALGRADATGLAGRVRRHVVVEHEAVAVLAHQRVDDLFVACSTERRHDHRLRFAAREQRRPVRAREYAGADRDRTHGARVAAVDPRLAGQLARLAKVLVDPRLAGKNFLANDLRFEIEHHVADVALAVGVGVRRNALRFDLRRDFVQALRPRLLRAKPIGVAQLVLRGGGHCGDQRLVLRRRLPIPQGLARLLDQLVDRFDHRLHLLVPEDDRAQHDFFRQLVRFGLDHQHRGFRARDDEIELRARELGLGRIQHVRAVDVANACRADRTVERNPRQRDRRRSPDQRRDIRIDFRIHRHDGRDDLHVVIEAIGEQRSERTVDETRGQRLLFRRPPFAAEESAGNLARGVGLFLVVDRQREKVLARLRLLGGDRGDQHDAVVQAHHHRTAGLAGDLAGFERQRMTAIGNRLLDVFLHNVLVIGNDNGRAF